MACSGWVRASWVGVLVLRVVEAGIWVKGAARALLCGKSGWT